MPLPWFRLYTEILHDPKLRRVNPDTRWVWIGLLCLASDSPERGQLLICDGIALTVADLASAIGVESSLVESAIITFTQLRMLEQEEDGTYRITNWDSRQFKSDNSTERVQRFRERQRERYNIVTATPPDTESETESETESTTNSNPAPAEVAQYAKIVSFCESMFGIRNELLQQYINERVDEYGLSLTLWAVQTAYEANARTWRYVDVCLENKKKEVGRGPPGRYTYHDPFLDKTVTVGEEADCTKGL